MEMKSKKANISDRRSKKTSLYEMWARILAKSLAVCKAKNEKGRNCGVIGHFMRACKRPITANFRRNVRFTNRSTSRRIDLIGQAENQSKESSEWEEDNVVLGLDGNGTPSIVLKGRINKQQFVAMIDSESPITIFTTEGLRKLLNTDVTFVRPLLKTGEYLHYNGRTLTFLG